MIKKYSYQTFEDSYIKNGDRVIVKYRDCPYYMKTGKIVSIITTGMLKGDCKVLIDYDNKLFDLSYVNLLKIEELVEVPTGEIIYVEYDDAIELAMAGAIRWNSNIGKGLIFSSGYYYFYEKDRWQIENYSI